MFVRSPCAGFDLPRPLEYGSGRDELSGLWQNVSDHTAVATDQPDAGTMSFPALLPTVPNSQLLQITPPAHTVRVTSTVAQLGEGPASIVFGLPIVTGHQVERIGEKPEPGKQGVPLPVGRVVEQVPSLTVKEEVRITPRPRGLRIHAGESTFERR